MTLHPTELATALQRDGLRTLLRRACEDAMDALVEAQHRLTAAQDALSAAARVRDLTQNHRDALALAEVDLRLAAAVVVQRRMEFLSFEKQAEAVTLAERTVASAPWHPVEHT